MKQTNHSHNSKSSNDSKHSHISKPVKDKKKLTKHKPDRKSVV